MRPWIVGVALLAFGLVGIPAAQAATGTLSGTISDGSGTALQATINIDQQGTTNVVATGTTAPDGSYSIPVNNGTYDVVVTPASSSYVPQTLFAVAVSGSSSLNVALVHAGTGTVSGRLVDDLGAPVSDVKMSLSDPSQPTTVFTTGPDGTFSLAVPNGQYKVSFDTQNCSGPSGDVPGTAHSGC
ncbi:MAG: carboxypeptidase-like regulatory domain-containing protein, partial [Marmoricola sp.]